MRTLTDITCKRCGCTESVMWLDPKEVQEAHTCPDGGRSDSFSIRERVVPGPGERGKDDESRRG